HRGLPRLALERRGEPFVRQQGRVDPAREAAEVLEGGVRLGAQTREQLSLFLDVLPRELLRKLQLHRERNELLLRAVVQVALDLASLFVLRGHESLPRGAELLDQPDVPEDQTRLCRQVLDELA